MICFLLLRLSMLLMNEQMLAQMQKKKATRGKRAGMKRKLQKLQASECGSHFFSASDELVQHGGISPAAFVPATQDVAQPAADWPESGMQEDWSGVDDASSIPVTFTSWSIIQRPNSIPLSALLPGTQDGVQPAAH